MYHSYPEIDNLFATGDLLGGVKALIELARSEGCDPLRKYGANVKQLITQLSGGKITYALWNYRTLSSGVLVHCVVCQSWICLTTDLLDQWPPNMVQFHTILANLEPSVEGLCGARKCGSVVCVLCTRRYYYKKSATVFVTMLKQKVCRSHIPKEPLSIVKPPAPRLVLEKCRMKVL